MKLQVTANFRCEIRLGMRFRCHIRQDQQKKISKDYNMSQIFLYNFGKLLPHCGSLKVTIERKEVLFLDFVSVESDTDILR